MINGVECVAASVTSTQIVCTTGPHQGSIDAKVEVQVSGNGIANEVCLLLKLNNVLDINSFLLKALAFKLV